jgi:DNA-binding MarR family transcriptional regulator
MPLRLIPQIHRVTHRIGLSLDTAAALGVTQGEAHVLAHLHDYGDSTIADVHRAFAHRRSTLTSILDRLVARRLIRRTTGEDDRRTFVLSLTPAGRRLATRVSRHLAGIEARVLKHLSRDSLKGFETVMARLEAELAELERI